MGVVYLAEDTLLGRRVAIKTIHSRPGADDRHFRARFLREARAVSALSHPHIATIYDYGETEEAEPYIVMELIKGATLGELMLTATSSLRTWSSMSEVTLRFWILDWLSRSHLKQPT